MKQSLAERIDAIRQKPEHIRLRYTIGLALLSMVFIVAVWFMTVKQSFQISVPQTKEKVEEMQTSLEGTEQIEGSVKSLKELGTGESIRIKNNNQGDTGEFIDGEIQKSTKPLGIPSAGE